MFFSKNKNLKNRNEMKNVKISKKIGFLSVILLTIGSSIGAGIFFKNNEVVRNATFLNNPTGTITLTILSWVIASISVIAMALALLEIVSAQKDDRGIVGWTKIFTHKVIYKSCKNFFVYLYMPFNYFVLPYYALQSFQNAIGFDWPWFVYMIVSFFISTWFIFISGLSSKIGNIQNWIITLVKFLPLIFAILIGYIIVGFPSTSGIFPSLPPSPTEQFPNALSGNPFNVLNPGLGLILSIPAIFFAFDGFYVAAGIQSQVKNPKRTSLALGIGLAITSFVYMLITISIIIVSNGFGNFESSGNIQSNGITQWFFENNATAVLVLINFIIGFGILGIINGFSMYSPLLYEDLIRDKEIPFTSKFIHKLNKNRPWVGIWVSYIIAMIVFIVFSLVGSLTYFNSSEYGDTLNLVSLISFTGTWTEVLSSTTLKVNIDPEVNNLFSMVDLMANWASLFAFVYIGAAIIGAIINRKTKKIEVKKSKFFLIAAWTSAIVVNLGMLFVFIGAFSNLIMVAFNFQSYVINNGSAQATIILNGQVARFIVLMIFIAIAFLPIFWDKYSEKRNQIEESELKIIKKKKC
ncbi:APC family permease [[Mycoplasma] mobile]|uniref:Amino acid permease n=1 Tax=Mycoplasma mobile (strain ATCC 43663 / 163K / NCTC 11711) TaxID=267748 RepID=Q6KI68_MYCM1|nr:APC family permease [[Mycoplasma] mobile]AAT27708.1 amino acid permease [Mycoplasma mobile 163K]